MQYILNQDELDELKGSTEKEREQNSEREAIIQAVLNPRRVSISSDHDTMMGGAEFVVLKIELGKLPMSLQDHYRRSIR